MSQKIIKGNEIQLFYQDHTFAYATAHTLTLTGNTSDTASKDHGEWGATDVTSVSWEVTGEYFYTDDDYDKLFDLMLYRRPIYVKIAEVKNYDENGLSDFGGRPYKWVPSPVCRAGYAVITSLTANANTGEKATYSLTLTGNGPLVVVDNTLTNYYIDVKYDPEDIADNMIMFNDGYGDSITSGWVYDTWNNRSQIDISDGKLHDPTPEPEDTIFRFYFSGPAIPEYLFQNNNSIKEVIISGNVYVIQEYAFSNSSINKVYTDTDMMNYMHHCFNNCNFLEDINYNSSDGYNYLGAEKIGNNAFSTCVRLGDIATGNSCEYALAGAFSDCMVMNDVYFGDSLRRLGDNAFTVTSHGAPKNFHFYTETAPYLGNLPLGPVTYQTIYLHNCASVQDWLTSCADWRQYADADIRIAN